MKKNSLKYISFEALFYNLYFHLCIISHQFLPFYMQTNKDYINMVDWLFIIVPFHALSRETLETALTHYGEWHIVNKDFKKKDVNWVNGP